MKAWVFTICYNQADIIGYWLRHYETFADRILVWDDKSTDGTRKILENHPKVTVQDWPYDDGLEDNRFLEFAHDTYPTCRGDGVDWTIWVDTDEFIWAADIVGVLTTAKASGFEAIKTQGYNMTGDGLPVDDGRQIWELNPMGIKSPVYSKPIVVNPSSTFRWNRGKHAFDGCALLTTPEPLLKLLHYRYLGFEYTKQRNARNYERCCIKTGDKACAWTCSPNHRGMHSAEWAEEAKKYAYNVLLE